MRSLRLQRRLQEAQLAELNKNFVDIIKAGPVVQSAALPEEQDEATILHLPRLVFTPHKRSFGRFREFINAINDCDN